MKDYVNSLHSFDETLIVLNITQYDASASIVVGIVLLCSDEASDLRS